MVDIAAMANQAWPLKFKRHNFRAYYYNTLACSIIYNRYQFSLHEHQPSAPPPPGDYRAGWAANHIIGTRFPGPIHAQWTALDGSEHRAEIDLEALFADRLVRHNLSRDDFTDDWLAGECVDPVPVEILMELNDRTVSIFSQALLVTKEYIRPDNRPGYLRKDLVRVWTHTY